MEKMLFQPTWLIAIEILGLAIAAWILGRLIVIAMVEIPRFIEEYPLIMIESERPNCRATWFSKGVMLTSRASGVAIAEWPTSDVRAFLANNSGLFARFSLRFCHRLRIGNSARFGWARQPAGSRRW